MEAPTINKPKTQIGARTEAKPVGRVVPAQMAHVNEIHALITYWAERHLMLFRGLEELYECIRDFRVLVDAEGKVLGCCAMEVLWRDMGEIKSLAVDPDRRGQGIGTLLVSDALADASRLGLSKVFALTYKPEFFKKHGFVRVDKASLPHKVWTDCIRCPLQNECREEPMLLDIGSRQSSSAHT